MGDRGRRSLSRGPWPHDGSVLIKTPDMEHDLRLVWEGHCHGVAVQGSGAPRTYTRVVDFHPLRTSCLRHRFSFTRGAGAVVTAGVCPVDIRLRGQAVTPRHHGVARAAALCTSTSYSVVRLTSKVQQSLLCSRPPPRQSGSLPVFPR
jgi:hypothetical protein